MESSARSDFTEVLSEVSKGIYFSLLETVQKDEFATKSKFYQEVSLLY